MATLTSIRRGLNSIVAMAILGLLIASFALWGIPDVFTGGARTTVAKVGSQEISAQDFLRAYDRRIKQIEAQLGQPLDRSQAAALGLPQQVLQQMISERTIDLYAHRLGLRASRRQMIETLHAMEAFKGFDGQFDRTTYELQLRNAGYTPAQFEADLRREIARLQLIDALASWRPAPEVIADPLFRYRHEARRATVISVPLPPTDSVPPPSDEEIAKAYDLEKENYKTPEYRHALVAEISAATVANPAAISEEDLKQAYEERKDEFVSPELRNVDLVTFTRDEKEKAEEFARRLRAGEDYEKLLSEMTKFSPDEAALGDVSHDDLVKDYSAKIADRVFATPAGGITDPLASVFGWHVFRVRDVTPPRERKFAQVADELRTRLARERAEEKVYDLSVKAEEAIARGADLNEVAEKLGLKLHEAPAVNRDGMLKDDGLADEVIRRHLKTIFTLAPEDPVEFVSMNDGGFALVDVLEVIPPEIRPLEEVKNVIRANLIAERRLEAAGKKADDILKRMREEGLSPEEAAKLADGDVLTTDWIERIEAGRGNKVASGIGRLMFDLKKGEMAEERAADGNGYLIVRLDDVRFGDPRDPTSAQAYADLKRRLAEERVNDLLVMLEKSLRDEFGVEINEALLRSLVVPENQG